MEETEKSSTEWWDLLIDGNLFVSVSGRRHAENFLHCMRSGDDQPDRFTLAPSRVRKIEDTETAEISCDVAAVRPW
jgi:hypothetical protein